MKSMILFFGLALLSTTVIAGEREQLQQIADRAGVSINDVRMVLGSRTQFAQYRSSYDRKEARVMAAVAELAAEQRAERERPAPAVAVRSK
ncbi:hypothetical protein ACFPOA_15030 [Lysobacter niabensis]|uniref:hypothetical protein n=1 Tax=Agrilutibacter niabensis TaxID=380628 RepID=UPI003617E3A6